ncbi:transcriptional regulator [Paucilactobacillus hokkaidonensis JCM 18461]|uniref:Transcriptional regulator n=2 Tax=Paucilactobacillus hokkaidonensis TaxID=1193095 RepID=A0A0A1GXP8_9LACO|nr:LCP family protein [Paucilactobacillus hokkaidonensis]KRO09542.1 cell envelope-related transcriptional attenuator [Paucilactobacillus hokkaidonensis]BAP85236.1 transcriptional regulator [Paucilactobacillus hokkaidonensis JCM 18461]
MDHQETRASRHNNNHGKPKRHWIRWVIGIIAILLVAAGGYEYYKIHNAAEGIFSSGNNKVSQKLKDGKPVSVLLMGLDTGAIGRGNSGGNTDTLELVTVNPKKETITMTSIPRDTLVKLKTSKGTDYVKINAAYSIGGPKKTQKAVAELLHVPIDYYAIVNMGVLEKVVNAVGGVDVDNPFKFTYEGHTFKKGKQHLNGTNALKYSRMRYDDPNNDYGRQKRQQQIIKAVIKELKSASSVTAINTILDAAKKGIRTNVPINAVATLYANYHTAMNTVKTYHFEGKNATISGTSFQIAVPKEINRVSKLVRTALGLKFSKVTNNETKLYNMQTNYDGYNNVDFVLPNGASYNDAGSGSSTSTGTSSSTGASSTGTGTTYGTSTAGTGYSSYTGTGTGTTNSTVSSPTGGTTETVPAN